MKCKQQNKIDKLISFDNFSDATNFLEYNYQEPIKLYINIDCYLKSLLDNIIEYLAEYDIAADFELIGYEDNRLYVNGLLMIDIKNERDADIFICIEY